MPIGIPEMVAELLKLLNKTLGYVTEPTGWEQLTRENQLKVLMRGANVAIEKDDWAAYDAFMSGYRELRQQT